LLLYFRPSPSPQIGNEFNRFAKFMPGVKCAVLFGGLPRAQVRQWA
jgi:hypothetical protein